MNPFVYYFLYILLFGAGWVAKSYLGSYSSQRGKNKADIEDANRIELIKNQIKLDFDKKGWTAKAKYENYTKFMRLLDEHNALIDLEAVGKFNVFLIEYHRGVMDEPDRFNELTSIFQSKVIEHMNGIRLAASKIKNETNEINLIGSLELLALIKKYEDLAQEAFTISMAFLTDMASSNTQDEKQRVLNNKIAKAKEYIKLNQDITDTKKLLIQTMRKEIGIDD